MPPPISKLTDRLWAQAFAEAARSTEKKPQGDGWKTVHDIVADLSVANGKKMGKCKVQSLITKLVRARKLEVFNGSFYNENLKFCCRRVWYRPIS